MESKKNLYPILIGSPKDISITDPSIFVEYNLGRLGVDRSILPDRYILTFRYTDALNVLRNNFDLTVIELADSPLYVFDYKGVRIGFRYMGIGAPAAGLVLEGSIALGGKYFVFFGGVGVLLRNIRKWEFIIPSRAIRDEGTSFHYLEPSFYAYPSKMINRVLMSVLSRYGVEYRVGGVWTTDAPYRETFYKRDFFLKRGAICVDMEAAALFAIAKYRGVNIGGIFYAVDLVGDEWDLRAEEDHEVKRFNVVERLISYSVEVLSSL